MGIKYFLRDEMGAYLNALGKKSRRVVAVTADLASTSRITAFAAAFPERFYNMGIAEQNLVSFSAGLAHEGFIPFSYSMAPFLSMRACEQCRTDVAYANVNVRLMATYAGVSGGISGATHWGMEDCAIMTAMPNMTVLEPCDVTQGKRMMDAMLTHQGPVYCRISVEPSEQIYNAGYTFEIGRASIPRAGNDGAFICSGIIVKYALQAARNIAAKTGQQIRVVDMHTMKPIDREAVVDAAKTGAIVTAQDHNVIGGLGYHVASVLAQEGLGIRFKIQGIPDQFEPMAHAPYLYHQFGLDAEGLEAAMLNLLQKQG